MANFEEISEARRLLDLREDVARTYPHNEYLKKYYYGWFEGI
jgi:hypothetical protein